jgi:hypothetical protein
MAAGLTFLLLFPGVLRLGAPTYLAATGLTQEPFAARWPLLTRGVLRRHCGAVCVAPRARDDSRLGRESA